MLAPRKKLWTTPPEVVLKAIEVLNPSAEDVVFDVGAGDGNFILKCSEITPATCIGVEIDEERAERAKLEILRRGWTDDNDSRCQMICQNALDVDFKSATCFFLYLIPRGLKIIAPILLGLNRSIRVVTYMSPLPALEIKELYKVSTPAHPEAQWPLYYYELGSHPARRDLSNMPPSIT